jgi:hypothetical protein
MIENRQHVCKLTFERMLEAPTMLYGEHGFGSNYQGQTETLGKHFQRPGGAAAGKVERESQAADDQLELPNGP